MADQYLRSFNLAIGNGNAATTISSMAGEPGLRVRFQIHGSDASQPNNALITITNLSDATANAIQKEYNQVVLQVGYQDNLATIFQGEIKQKIGNGTESPTETYFKILAAEGQKAYSYAFISKALAAGHTLNDQVNECLKVLQTFGITAGSIADLGPTKMPRGRSLFGSVREQLRAITRTANATWSIDGIKLNITKNNETLPGGAIIVNSQTGMIGTPVQTIEGIEVRTLLNPQIKPGTLLQINEKDIQQAAQSPLYSSGAQNALLNTQNGVVQIPAGDGTYKVLFRDHIGDTRGTEWYTDSICVALGTGMPPAAATRGPSVTN